MSKLIVKFEYEYQHAATRLACADDNHGARTSVVGLAQVQLLLPDSVTVA